MQWQNDSLLGVIIFPKYDRPFSSRCWNVKIFNVYHSQGLADFMFIILAGIRSDWFIESLNELWFSREAMKTWSKNEKVVQLFKMNSYS